MKKRHLRLVKPPEVFKMPKKEELVQMSQEQVIELAKPLDRQDRMTLITKWSLLKLSKQASADKVRLEKRCAENSKQTDRLKRAVELAHNATQTALGNQAKIIKTQSRRLSEHKTRLDNHESAIGRAVGLSKQMHQKAMGEIGAVVHAICENDGQLQDQKQRTDARLEYLARQNAALRRQYQEDLTALKRQIDANKKRAVVQTRAPSAPARQNGVFSLHGFATAAVSICLILLAAAFSPKIIGLAKARDKRPTAEIQCSFYDSENQTRGVVPTDTRIHKNKVYFLLDCGSGGDVELWGTLKEDLPKDGIFSIDEVVKISQ